MKISVQAAEVPVPCEVLRCSAAVPSEFGFRGARGWGHQGWSSSCFFLPPKANSANTSLNSLSDSTTFNNMPRTRCWRWVVVVVGAAQVWLLPRLARGFSAGPGCGCPAVCTAAEGAPPGLCPLPPSFHSWEITRQLFNLGWGRPRLFRKKKVGMKSTVPPPPPAHTHHERGARIGFLEKILGCPVLLEA